MIDWLTSKTVHSLAIISLAELALLYVMLVVLQSGGKPLRVSVSYWLPFLLYTLPAYLLIVWRLNGRPHDVLGLGLAMVVSAASVLLLAGLFIWLGNQGGGGLNVLAAVLMLHITLLVLCFVFVPTQLLIAYRAGAALRANGSYFPALIAGLAFTVCYLATASVVWRKSPPFGTDELSSDAAYSDEVMEGFLVRLYTCLWTQAGAEAQNGFPASEDALRALGPTCWDPATAPGGSVRGASYEFRYTTGRPDADGRVRAFALATRSRGWTPVSIYVDHLGIGRRDSTKWASADSRVISGRNRSEVPRILGFLDAFHEIYGFYPARPIASEQDRQNQDDVVIPHQVGARLVESRADGSFAVTTQFVSFRYKPGHTNSENKPMAYELMIPRHPKSIWTLRNYLIDNDGRVHATGEDRDATAGDPLVPEEEWRSMVPPQLRRFYTDLARNSLSGSGRRPDT